MLIRIVDKYYGLGIGNVVNHEANNTGGRDQSMTQDGGRASGKPNNFNVNNTTGSQGSSMYMSQNVTGIHGKSHRIHGSNEPLDLDNFTFELHTSFASEVEAMGLEVVDALVDLCEKHNLQHLFKHYCRISKVKPGEKVRQPVGKRMDENAYREEFE